jgi:hypothetical protein
LKTFHCLEAREAVTKNPDGEKKSYLHLWQTNATTAQIDGNNMVKRLLQPSTFKSHPAEKWTIDHEGWRSHPLAAEIGLFSMYLSKYGKYACKRMKHQKEKV